MKLVLRVLNLVMAALACVATILLFSVPAFSFNSKVVVDVNEFSKFVPETEYTKDLNVVELLGTDEIQAGIQFKLSAKEIAEVKNGNRDIINENVIVANLDSTLKILDDAVDVLADNTIRKTLQSTIKSEIAKQIEDAKPADNEKSVEELMDLIGLDDVYFKNFSNALYDEANKSTATVDKVGSLLQEQIDDALVKAEKSGQNLKSGTFTEEQRTAVRNNMVSILDQLEMVNPDNSLKPISDLPYLYLTKHVKEELKGKVPEAELEQKAEETNRDYSNRILEKYVITNIPDVVYQVVGYVSLGMFIGIFVFAAAWLALAAFEILHFIFVGKKHRLFKFLFLPVFMLIGIIQIAFGFVLTGVCKFVLPDKLDLSKFKIPVKELILVPRTCTLATSIVFIVFVAIGIAYSVIKLITPKVK